MKDEFRFFTPIRVRYSEVDWQRHMYNAAYLVYLDVAMTEYLRNLGWGYAELVEKEGFDPVLAKVTMEFKAPAYFDEILEVYVRVAEIGRTSFTMAFEIYKEKSDQVVLTAQIVYVNYETASRTPRPVPDRVRQAFGRFEGKDGTASAI